NWGSAFDNFCRYFSVVQGETEITLERQGDEARVAYRLNTLRRPGFDQDAEFSMALLANAVRLYSEKCRIHRIDFEHDYVMRQRSDVIFQAEIRGGQSVNAIYFPSAFLNKNTVNRNNAQSELICQDLQKQISNIADRSSLLLDIANIFRKNISEE